MSALARKGGSGNFYSFANPIREGELRTFGIHGVELIFHVLFITAASVVICNMFAIYLYLSRVFDDASFEELKKR